MTSIGEGFHDVLLAAQAGGAWAWTRIYRSLAPALLGFFRGRGERDPEDLVGEVFVHLARDLQNFEGDEAQFRAWVFTIAYRRMIDRNRRHRSDVAELVDHIREDAGVASDAESEALTRLGTARVRQLLMRLSPDQRDVLLLRILADLTVEQVAEALDKRPGAVKALQRRALAALRKEIAREGVPL